MGQREEDQRIQDLHNENVNCYSFSKLNTINNCLYEAWRTYVLQDRGLGSVYTNLGSRIHDTLEEIIHKQKETTDLLPAMRSELQDLELLGLDFPKDFRGGNSIRDKWIADMTHFCKTFVPPKGVFTTEELLIYRVSPTRAIIGYSDLIKHHTDKVVSIYDWKTSSDHRQEDLLEHGRQLTIYGMALEQAGFTVKETAWIMLKYITVEYEWYQTRRSKNKTVITKTINRSKLFSTIRDPLEYACRNAGMDEVDIEIAMRDFELTNILSDLFPVSVKEQFQFKPYVKKYPFTEELKQEAINYINRTADIYESLSQSKDIPWDARPITKKEEFYCHTLCSHRKTCPYIQEYDERNVIKKPSSDDDLF